MCSRCASNASSGKVKDICVLNCAANQINAKASTQGSSKGCHGIFQSQLLYAHFHVTGVGCEFFRKHQAIMMVS